MIKKIAVLLVVVGFCCPYVRAQVFYDGKPGKASAGAVGTDSIVLENNVLRVVFSKGKGRIAPGSFEDKVGKEVLRLAGSPLFEIGLLGGEVVSSDGFDVEGSLRTAGGDGDGKEFAADLVNRRLGVTVHWQVILRDGSNYVRQLLTFSARDSVAISRVSLIKFGHASVFTKSGIVDGLPILHNNMFFGLEHPMSQVEIDGKYSVIGLPRSGALTPAEPVGLSSVWGVAPKGQLRRGFLYYVERERARPYNQFLHYNSWFDLSWEDRTLNDSLCLDRIKVFGDSLITRRHTKLRGFLFDDGWDNYKTLWQFNSGFPDGFTHVKDAAAALGAGIGVWMSPWGGYDIRKPQRIEYGSKQVPPFETNDNGFTLTGPVYYDRFKAVTGNFIQKFDVSIFKFDGVGAGNGASGAGVKYQRDIEAFLRLITDLRRQKPSIYLSLTIGTWPSMYFLKYGDAIWRAGDDTGLEEGADGSKRQQWITYRSAKTYENIVQRSPLYPLNAVMYHGIAIADQGLPGKLTMDDKEIADDIWSFFGTGTALQEMYINPHKLNHANWDELAAAIHWVRGNEDILADVHWVGGSPAKKEIYGYAAWNNGKGMLMLRNPSKEKKTFLIDVAKVFDLPPGVSDNYSFSDARNSTRPVLSGKKVNIVLAPFQVVVMNARRSDK